MPAALLPSSCRLCRPPSPRSPPSLFLKQTIPHCQPGPEGAPPPVGDPLGLAVSGEQGGAEMAGRKTMAGQMAWWPRRAIIYSNSGAVRLKEREGEVAWRVLPLIRLLPATPPIMRNGWTSAAPPHPHPPPATPHLPVLCQFSCIEG